MSRSPLANTGQRSFDRFSAYTLCLLSPIGAIFLYWVTHRLIYPLLLSYVLISSILFLVKRQDIVNYHENVIPSGKRNNLALLFTSLFFSFLLLSSIAIITRPNIYSRPVYFFILISLLTLTIFLEIIFYEEIELNFKGYENIILFKIIILGIFIRLIPLNMFPGYVWFDPWFHERFVSEIIATGGIPGDHLFDIYSKIPIMHLIFAGISILTGLSFKSVFVYILIPILVIVQGTMVFLIISRFVSTKPAALLAALFVTIADDIVANGLIPFPNTLAMVFITVIVYSILRSKKDKDIRFSIISLLLLGVLVVTHTIGSLAMAGILFSFWVGSILYSKFFNVSLQFMPSTFATFTIFTVAMLSWWIYASGHFKILIDIFKWAFSMDLLSSLAPEKALSFYSSIPATKILLDRLGFSLYFAFAILGTFFFLAKKNEENELGLLLSIIGLAFGLIGFLGAALRAFVIPTRWFFMAQVMLAGPSAVGLIALSKSFNRQLLSLISIFFVMFTFSMFSSTTVNFDSPIFSSDTQLRYAFYDSEIKAMDTILKSWGGKISTDQHSQAYMVYHSRNYIYEFGNDIAERDFSQLHGSLVFVRNTIVSQPLYSQGVVWKLDYDLPSTLILNGYDLIYDNGSSRAYLHPN